jgi:hypothetical protein
MVSDDLSTAKSRLIDALRELERSQVPLTRVRELERSIGRLELLQHKLPANV